MLLYETLLCEKLSQNVCCEIVYITVLFFFFKGKCTHTGNTVFLSCMLCFSSCLLFRTSAYLQIIYRVFDIQNQHRLFLSCLHDWVSNQIAKSGHKGDTHEGFLSKVAIPHITAGNLIVLVFMYPFIIL